MSSPRLRTLGQGPTCVSGEIRGWTFMIIGYPIIIPILCSGVTKPNIKQFIVKKWRGRFKEFSPNSYSRRFENIWCQLVMLVTSWLCWSRGDKIFGSSKFPPPAPHAGGQGWVFRSFRMSPTLKYKYMYFNLGPNFNVNNQMIQPSELCSMIHNSYSYPILCSEEVRIHLDDSHPLNYILRGMCKEINASGNYY